MKSQTPAALTVAATAFASLYSKDPITLERTFGHLTPPALAKLDKCLIDEIVVTTTTSSSSSSSTVPSSSSNMDNNNNNNNNLVVSFPYHDDCYVVIAKAIIRRIVHLSLAKYKNIHSATEVETALKYHILPKQLQIQLAMKYGNGDGGGCGGDDEVKDLPSTWFDALLQLKQLVSSSSSAVGRNDNDDKEDDRSTTPRAATSLWRLILDHPMTEYVPVQCQSCGHVIPDETKSELTDSDVGLTEEEPPKSKTATEADRGKEEEELMKEDVEEEEDEILELRGGWFRGPRRPVIFVINCPKCHTISRWYRSSHPKIILNPNRWGRLCGEQEDLRLDLASYLNVQIRTCIPLDWDHIWSEYREDDEERAVENRESTLCKESSSGWQVHDENARNFAVRLDEGIGSFTGVLAISPNPNLCMDVTDEYLQCRKSVDDRGRADQQHESQMTRYRDVVVKARKDSTGSITQAGTLNGYVIQRANLTSHDVTNEMRKAALEYGSRGWWQV